jgi:hypothetical protein
VPDFAAAYTETRDRLVELVRPVDEPGIAAIVPATPSGPSRTSSHTSPTSPVRTPPDTTRTLPKT